MKRREILATFGVFIFFTFASFIGTFISSYIINVISPQPVVVQVVMPETDKIEQKPLVVEQELTIKRIVPKQTIDENFDIFQPCGYTVEELEYAVSDNSRDELLPYIDTFLEAEDTYGVNAFYLLCKLGLESGWGQYESGENNIGGWTNGDGSYKDFESVEECILYISRNLSTRYKESVGSKLGDVCRMYCPGDGYLETLMGIMLDREAKIQTI